ncbi:D-glycero-alpha-D-manno-heptose-1,7-bisphosphate 7-phosphatase [Wenjunlia tyrosinilytica]|uniref:D,D-heptose 1,7-bisphosphate phosphatase n=1 Tax=Wenjunlia tyrosinilytica TaxID=1544741 RepID=A0A918DWE0_9ACTN|nr:HAD-IIIA family hydrolase [Wenjunlia tyrosinilytica]GGO84714.1 hypothetical protein GCM10012280_16820 [Wenjunlia tyrosinilytica]
MVYVADPSTRPVGRESEATVDAAPPWVFQRPLDPARAPVPEGLPLAVLFDRDGTLVEDVPYNGDPALVRPMPWALDALGALRARGIPVGVVSNQSGVARGLLTRQQVEAVQRRIEQFLGPFDVWVVCPHGTGDGCGCRKPAPGLVLTAAECLDVHPSRVAVIGDVGSDVEAARAAGARGVLVPNPYTRLEEVADALEVEPNLLGAVRRLLRGDRPDPSGADGGPAR